MSRVRFRVVGLILLMLAGVGGPTHAQVLSDTLTFEQATALLRQHNPQLRAARARAQAQERAAEADALYPNPTVSVEEERTNLPNGGDDQWYASIRQPLRYPGEQGARARSADATQQATGAMVEEERTRLYNELRHRYLDVVGAQARVDVLRSFSEAIQEAATAAQVRYEEGDLGTFRRARLKVAQAQYENERAEAERRLRTARTELAALLLPDGSGSMDPGTEGGRYRVAGSMQFQPVDVEEDDVRRRAMTGRAAVRAADARVQARTADVDAAEYQRYPSLSLSAGPKRQSVPTSTTYGYTAGVSIGLPLWNGGRTRGDGKVYVLPVERGLDIRTQSWMEDAPATAETE